MERRSQRGKGREKARHRNRSGNASLLTALRHGTGLTSFGSLFNPIRSSSAPLCFGFPRFTPATLTQDCSWDPGTDPPVKTAIRQCPGVPRTDFHDSLSWCCSPWNCIWLHTFACLKLCFPGTQLVQRQKVGKSTLKILIGFICDCRIGWHFYNIGWLFNGLTAEVALTDGEDTPWAETRTKRAADNSLCPSAELWGLSDQWLRGRFPTPRTESFV